MRRIKLIIEYNGAAYGGWQRQKNAVTVQQRLEEAIFAVTGERLAVTGASRTDAGVHALGQTVHFDTEAGMPAEKFAWALNTKLPPDIRCVLSSEAEEGFHARFSAKGKKYIYRVHNAPHASALYSDMTWHFFRPLDLDTMRSAAADLIGRKDFYAFMAAGSAAKTTVREIYSLDIRREGQEVVFEITGSGFLYNMVRIIVGTLCYIGCGKLPPDTVRRMLETRDRTLGGPTAEPGGLTLAEVWYK